MRFRFGSAVGWELQPQSNFAKGARVATSIHRHIAKELGVREQQVEAAVALLDGGATVPFIARYRKEATGALDDAQLRALEERLNYLRELEERRAVILKSIREQGKLDAALETAILAADSKGRLEDIYLPFRPKRRTKAEIAKEAGLEPLADLLLAHPEKEPQAAAAAFVNAEKQVPDVTTALDGARAILVERFAEDADLIGSLREQVWSSGRLTSRIRDGKVKPAPSSATISISAKPLPSCRRTASWHCFAARRRRSSISPSSRKAPRLRRPAAAPTSCASCTVLPSPTAGVPATDG
jgi:transcriptional accessory protein Tex/SPT6